MTPLHVAAQHGHVKIVEYFVKQGADVNFQDHNGVFSRAHDDVILLRRANKNDVIMCS